MRIINKLSILFVMLFLSLGGFSQPELSEIPFFGYTPGDQFTFHHDIIAYAEHIGENSPKATMVNYGKTYEGRDLVMLIITDPENMAQLEQIRTSHINKTGLASGPTETPTLPVVWLNYNIHGDEASASEAAIATIHHLVTSENKDVKNWLKSTIIIIDPCVNPDGREHYVTWFKSTKGSDPNANPDASEHHHPWSSGRQNHYLMDLNRDWAWQTQIENQQRLAAYKKWMPMVHCDFHEMGVEEDYFFAPAAEPLHKDITKWQIKFQNDVGANHAKHFNDYGWLYFTSSDYDLFYPSYGDTWPIFNGAIGFTYEQGGSRRAGLAVKRKSGKVLTLKERILHHVTTGLSTLETTYAQRDKLSDAFYKYFEMNASNPPGPYKSYIIKYEEGADKHALRSLMDMLDRQQIKYGSPDRKKLMKGYGYKEHRERSFEMDMDDLVISTSQPMATLIKVLFEPEAELEDSLTYDATAWALPYAYNLEVYAVKENIEMANPFAMKQPVTDLSAPGTVPYGYICEWKDARHAEFLSMLHASEIKVRATPQPLIINGQTFERGSLLILRNDQEVTPKEFQKALLRMAKAKDGKESINLYPLNGARTDNGVDLGHYSIQTVDAPKIALISGKGVSQTGFGEMWFFLDQELHCPVTIIASDYLSYTGLNKYDVVILPGGGYGSHHTALLNYVKQGGTLIAVDGAVDGFASYSGGDGKPPKTALASAIENADEEEGTSGDDKPVKYGDSERRYISGSAAGSIYRANLDDTHPLSFGIGSSVFLMKRNSSVFPWLPDGDGWTVGRYDANAHVSGFIGAYLKEELKGTLAIGTEHYGNGQLVYFPDSPVFRNFWHGGKMLMCNAIFMRDF